MFSLNLMLAEPEFAACPLSVERMNSLVLQVLETQDQLTLEAVNQVELSLQLLGPVQMQALNLQYREQNKATNVLSFESSMPILNEASNDALYVLGDLVFCPEVIAKEAQEQRKTSDEHWVHLLVHGTLHLCGYDHIEIADADNMEHLETRILASLGLPDPYRSRSI